MKALTVRDFRYGERVWCRDDVCENIGTIVEIKKHGIRIKCKNENEEWFYFENSKILKILRRIEDMTEDECVSEDMIRAIGDELISLAVSTNDGHKIRGEQVKQIASIVDYRDRIGIDQRGYIDAGLAVDAKDVQGE